MFLFDQHACHERIRLENMIQENMDDDFNLVDEILIDPIRLPLNPMFESIVELLKLQMKTLGFRIDLESRDAGDETWLFLQIRSIPKILLKKFSRDQSETLIIISNLVESQLKYCLTTNFQSIANKNKRSHFCFSQIPIEILEV